MKILNYFNEIKNRVNKINSYITNPINYKDLGIKVIRETTSKKLHRSLPDSQGVENHLKLSLNQCL